MLLCLHLTLALHNIKINGKTHANKLIFLYLECSTANKKWRETTKQSQKLCFSILSGNFFLLFEKGFHTFHLSLGPHKLCSWPWWQSRKNLHPFGHWPATANLRPTNPRFVGWLFFLRFFWCRPFLKFLLNSLQYCFYVLCFGFLATRHVGP